MDLSCFPVQINPLFHMENGHSCNINNLSVNIGKHISFSEQQLSTSPTPFSVPAVFPPRLCELGLER